MDTGPAPYGRNRLRLRVDRGAMDSDSACCNDFVRALLLRRPESRRAELAMGKSRGNSCDGRMARSIGSVLVVCVEFRHVWRNLWRAGGSGNPYPVAVSYGRCRLLLGPAQRGNP